MAYKLTLTPPMIIRLSDGALITIEDRDFRRWCMDGNQPLPPDVPPQPEVPILTPEEKLAQAGLTVEELKGLLGIQ